jgi:hypothetical protein
MNWVQVGLNNMTVYSLTASGNNIFAGTYENGVFLSNNNGSNWFAKSQGFGTNTIVKALLITNNNIFAGTDNSVWRRIFSEIIGIQNVSTETPSLYSLSQNYPNPFNPITNVKFSIINSGNVKLVVFDIMGREVQTLVNERLRPGTYETTFDGSKLNSGVYFYKLITDAFTETKRMTLLK